MERRKPGAPRNTDGITTISAAYVERDSDLRARRGAVEREEAGADVEDGMVEASPSLWTGAPQPRLARAAKQGANQAATKRGGAGKWAAIGALVFAGGGGLAFGVSALGPSDEAAPLRATAAIVVTSPPEQRPVETTRPPREPAATTPKPKPAPEPAPTKPPEWIAAVERTNPWVTLAGADRDRLLGVNVEALASTYADRITGLWPDRRVMAPREGYALQLHEVSWGELESAAGSIGGVSALVRPAWVPEGATKRAALPATGVPWAMARAFCRTIGGDLPTEAQWEWAARGPGDHYFPWGREAVDSNKVRIFARKPVPLALVGKSSQDVTSETGLRDMLGNAQEWTRDVWSPGRGSGAGPEAPKLRVVRGWPLTARGEDVPSEGSTYREAECADKSCVASAQAELIGFRCMKPLPSR